LVFVNVGALPALVEARFAHMDATFYSTPRGYYQLASVHAISHGISVATRFGTFFGTLNFVRFGTNFFCFGTAIVFFGTATRGGPKYWYFDV
jgi:hypothetical protein